MPFILACLLRHCGSDGGVQGFQRFKGCLRSEGSAGEKYASNFRRHPPSSDTERPKRFWVLSCLSCVCG